MFDGLLAALPALFGTTVGRPSPLRERLLGMIKDDPGQHAMALCRSSGASWSTVQYHLDLLRKGELVTAVDAGRTRRFFPSDVDERKARLLAMVREGRRPELTRFLLENPGARQVDICEGIGVSRKTFRHAVAPLVEEGMIAERRSLRDNRYFPSGDLEAVLRGAVGSGTDLL